ncbi:MAG: ydjZ 2 [Clostridiales bacterium]|nr:ydjZ 2 [Clostridiales bacterium]
MTRGKVIKLILFIIVLSCLVVAGIQVVPVLLELIKDPDSIRTKLESYGALAPLVYVIIQILQVIFVVIPADILTVCAGYVFGIPLAVVLSLCGLLFGSMSAFYMARFFGRNFVKSIIKKDKLDRINNVINSSKGSVGLFLICMIPLVPKDLLMYVSGITPIKERRLFPVYLISRIPGVIVGASIGANTHDKDYKGIMLSLIGLVGLVIVTYLLNKLYHEKHKKRQK